MAATAAEVMGILPCFPAKDLSTFRVESLLGGGGFSHVVLARDRAGLEWAMKLIPAPGAKSLADVDSTPLLLSEARIHLLLSHEPSVLPCLEAFKSVYFEETQRGPVAGGQATYMAVLRMPVAACSVEEWLFSVAPQRAVCQGAPQLQVDEKEVLSVWVQMVNAVHRCHSNGVIHKDIKLPNFLMDSRGKVQIMDFGLSQVDGVTPRAAAGTPWTMSPAGFKHGDDGRAGDWWSLGVVLYQLLQGGAWPFKQCWWPWQKGGGERMEAAIRRAVLAGRITFHDGVHVSEPIKHLIRGLLQPDPSRRWQLRQVLASELVTPLLLTGLGQRFPELAPDMDALLQLKRRGKEVGARRSDGGNMVAAGSGLGVGMAAAVAAGAARVRGLSVAAGDAGLHWPHWPGARGPHAGSDGSSHRPLLGPDSVCESPGGAASPPGAAASPTAPSATGMFASAVPTRALVSRPAASGVAAEDLLLLLPDEKPKGHPSPPSTPRPEPPPQRGAASGTDGGVPKPVAVSTSAAGQGGTSVSASGHGVSVRHAYTTSLSNAGDSDGARRDTATTSLSGMAEGREEGDASSSQPRPSHRSLSGPQEYRSPRGRTSRTSLHDLFSTQTSDQLLAPLPPPQHNRNHNHQQHLHHHANVRAMSMGPLGGVLRSSIDLIAGVAGHRAALQRHSGNNLLLQQQQPPPGTDAGGCGRRLGGDDSQPLPQSSWVPPPPESLACAGGQRRSGEMGSPVRLSGGRAVGSPAGGLADSAAAAWHGPSVGHSGILARARRLFADCLQRPEVKYDVYDVDEYSAYKALPGQER